MKACAFLFNFFINASKPSFTYRWPTRLQRASILPGLLSARRLSYVVHFYAHYHTIASRQRTGIQYSQYRTRQKFFPTIYVPQTADDTAIGRLTVATESVHCVAAKSPATSNKVNTIFKDLLFMRNSCVSKR